MSKRHRGDRGKLARRVGRLENRQRRDMHYLRDEIIGAIVHANPVVEPIPTVQVLPGGIERGEFWRDAHGHRLMVEAPAGTRIELGRVTFPCGHDATWSAEGQVSWTET